MGSTPNGKKWIDCLSPKVWHGRWCQSIFEISYCFFVEIDPFGHFGPKMFWSCVTPKIAKFREYGCRNTYSMCVCVCQGRVTSKSSNLDEFSFEKPWVSRGYPFWKSPHQGPGFRTSIRYISSISLSMTVQMTIHKNDVLRIGGGGTLISDLCQKDTLISVSYLKNIHLEHHATYHWQVKS